MIRAPSVALIAAILLAAGSARAEEPDPAARREANAFLHEGNRLFQAGDAEGALALFRRAYDRFPSPRLLVNVATALGQLGRDAEAAEAYERVLAAPPEEVSAALRHEVEVAFAAVEARIGRVRISVSADGAAVTIDGNAAGTSPLAAPVRVPPGHHVVAATFEGGTPVEVGVDVAAGESTSVSLAPAPPTPVIELGIEPPPEETPAVPDPAPPPAAPRPRESTSIWGTWWLWTGVGVVVAGAVTTLVVVSGGNGDGSRTPTELGTVP